MIKFNKINFKFIYFIILFFNFSIYCSDSSLAENKVSKESDCNLSKAIMANDIDQVKELLLKIPANKLNSNGDTPLYCACSQEKINEEIIAILLTNKANKANKADPLIRGTNQKNVIDLANENPSIQSLLDKYWKIDLIDLNRKICNVIYGNYELSNVEYMIQRSKEIINQTFRVSSFEFPGYQPRYDQSILDALVSDYTSFFIVNPDRIKMERAKIAKKIIIRLVEAGAVLVKSKNYLQAYLDEILTNKDLENESEKKQKKEKKKSTKSPIDSKLQDNGDFQNYDAAEAPKLEENVAFVLRLLHKG